MSDPHDSRRSDLPSRRDLKAPSSGGSMWTWLATLVVILVLLGLAIGYHRTEQADNNQSNAPATTGAAPAPPANPGSNASRPPPAIPAPAAPAPNEGPH